MHAMYSENAVHDIHDLISDDDIDLDQFASMCDPYSHFYSDFSAPQSREHSAWNREHLGRQDSRAPSLESREHLAWDRRKAENQLVKQGPHGPTTTPQAAPNPILNFTRPQTSAPGRCTRRAEAARQHLAAKLGFAATLHCHLTALARSCELPPRQQTRCGG